ncbi:hypothetical protein POG22_07595 [Geitlerinema sp. CS-897]|nr:hypothetical protein [Geitlerinema sp. CS-897]
MRVIRRSRYVSWNSFDRAPKGFGTVDFSWTGSDGRLHQIHRRYRLSPQISFDRFFFDFDEEFDRDRWLSDFRFDRPLLAFDVDEFPTYRDRVGDRDFETNPFTRSGFDAINSDVIDVEVIDERSPQKRRQKSSWKEAIGRVFTSLRHRVTQFGKRFRKQHFA